jgi:L-fucose isomerase-like protein
VEAQFKNIFKEPDDHYWLLAGKLHNALPAAMEIATFLREKGKKAEIIHGNTDYIVRRIKNASRVWQVKNKLPSIKLGVIGKPSDWLIASEVDYEQVKNKLGISLFDIEISELFHEMEKKKKIDHSILNKIKDKTFAPQSITIALNIYYGLKHIINKYKLDGITVRCFDFIEKYKNTGCLGLSLINSEGIIAGCEGDIPSAISMLLLNLLTDRPIFMANPASIDLNRNEIILAHCTLPLNMPDTFQLTTHFESDLGVGIKGHIPEGRITIFKLSSDLKTYFVSGGEILENLNRVNLCRTQIKLKLDENINYFLHRSLGNHHLVCRGNYSGLVREFFNW